MTIEPGKQYALNDDCIVLIFVSVIRKLDLACLREGLCGGANVSGRLMRR